MRFKVPFLRYALAATAFLLPTVVFAAILPFLINAQPVRAKLLREIGSWTGAEVKVAGSISVQDFFSLSVEAQDVEIGQFKAIPPIESMKAERIIARIAWFNLLSGNFNFDKIKVFGAVLKVRAGGPQEAATLFSDLVSGPNDTPFDAVSMDKSVIALHHADGAPDSNLIVNSALARTAKGGRQLDISASLVWKGEWVNLGVRSGFRVSPNTRVPLRLNVKSAVFTGHFDGQATLGGPSDAEGNLGLRTPDLAKAAEWLGTDIDPGMLGKAVSASGLFTVSEDQVSLTSGEIGLAGQTAQTTLTLKRSETRPHLEGVLAFDRFDVTALLAAQSALASATEWPFATPFETDLRISAKTLSWNDLQAGPTALTLASKPGRLAAEIAELVFLGGEMRGHIAVDSAGQVPRISARLSGESLDAAEFLRLAHQRDWLTGEADVNVEAELALDDPGQIVNRLVARARVNFPEGGLMRLDIPRLAASPFAPTDGWGAFDFTNAPFDRLRFDLTLREGQISFANVVLAAGGRQLNGRGEIDLAARSLDWRFISSPPASEPERESRAAGGQTAGGDGIRLSIKGPWANPTIRNDSAPTGLLPAGNGHAAALEVSPSGR